MEDTFSEGGKPHRTRGQRTIVLILISVEDTFSEKPACRRISLVENVLILISVEDTFSAGLRNKGWQASPHVLILISVEDTFSVYFLLLTKNQLTTYNKTELIGKKSPKKPQFLADAKVIKKNNISKSTAC